MTLVPVDAEPLLRELYDAFNAHNVDLLLGELSPDVDWPNAWEGGRLHGHHELRVVCPWQTELREGERVHVRFQAGAVHVFDKTEQAVRS